MKLLNLVQYSNEYFNFIYSDSERLIYTTKRKEKDGNYFYICNYYISTGTESIIKKFVMEDDTYYNYKVFYKEEILFILYKKKNILDVHRITNIFLKQQEKSFNIYLEGDIKHIKILDNRYFVVFIEKKDFLSEHFKKYRSSKSFKYKFSYLVDLYEVESYFVKDLKFTLGARDYVFLVNTNGERNIFFEEAYREAWEKEFYYFRGIFDKESKIKENNSMNYMNFDKFIEDIKLGVDKLNFHVIDDINRIGTIRFLGQDEDYIYYRKKMFDIGEEFIYSFEKYNMNLQIEKNIDHNNRSGEFYYDSDKISIFYEEDLGDYNKLIGIFNRNCDIKYSKDIGMFEDFIEDRYLITYYSDEYDGDNYNYAVVKDVINNRELRYDGNIRSIGDYVILY